MHVYVDQFYFRKGAGSVLEMFAWTWAYSQASVYIPVKLFVVSYIQII